MADDAKLICPLCNIAVDKLLYRYHVDSERTVIDKIKSNNPVWAEQDGICSRCIDYYTVQVVMEQRMLPEVGPFFPVKAKDDFVILPTGIRVDASPRYTGRGVTICFIDSGFYPHPDLVANKNRIKKFIDITDRENDSLYEENVQNVAAWHGTMTSVVCAGDGYLSNGLYKGIASDAELVLIKVQDKEGRIKGENIRKALEWVIQNHIAFNIRVVNMSLGDDYPQSYKESKIDILAEKLVALGINIVAAVGNDVNGAVKPPANSLNVIAVGGFDDENLLGNGNIKPYHSTYGETTDGLRKPELVAQSIWIAAPILPGTPEKEEAEALHALLEMSDEKLCKEFLNLGKKTKLSFSQEMGNDVTFVRQSMLRRTEECRYISADYMHVDGTSFAAPIISSVIAQLLEADPSLQPAQIREVLFRTAMKIPNIPAERQGFGRIHPRKAIIKILKREVIMRHHQSPHINSRKKTIAFYCHNDCASQISLSGSFNHWAQDVLLMEPGRNGEWKIEIPLLPKGKYSYKFFVDDRMWVEDVENPLREPDGVNGWNSVLEC